jgi:CBS domain-containing protein
MKVSELMTRRVRSCTPHHSLDVVMRILWEEDLGALPVVNDEGQPLAMITDRDVSVAAYTQGKPLWQITVDSAMSRQLYTAHVSDQLSSAERTMRSHQVRRLPVVDESTRLVGVLSLADIARARAAARPGSSAEEPLAELALTLSSVTRRPGPQEPKEPVASPSSRRERSARDAPPSRSSSGLRHDPSAGSSSQHARR